jgi:hypothetical protein
MESVPSAMERVTPTKAAPMSAESSAVTAKTVPKADRRHRD